MTDETPAIVYLTSHYPALSQPFIEREIAAVRTRGFRIFTATVRPFEEADLRSEVMRTEASRTQVLIGAGTRAWLSSHARVLRHLPGVARTIPLTLRAGDSSAKAKLWQVFYLTEAILLHDRMRLNGLRHIHVHHANVSASVAQLTCALGNAIDRSDEWSWSITIHGSAEFQYAVQWDVAEKVRQAVAVSCICDFTRAQVMQLVEPEHWGKMRVTHMTVDEDRYVPPDSRRKHNGPLRLLTIGRLVTHKGLPILVQAISTLRARGIPVASRVIGEGPLMVDLQQMIEAGGLQEWIELVGPVGQDHIVEHYHWADVYVSTSLLEGLPVVLMEAMACELPVVATQISGIPELITQDSGRVVPAGRADLVADAIAEMAADSDLRIRMGRSGRRIVLAEYTSASAGPQMAAFLHKAMQREA